MIRGTTPTLEFTLPIDTGILSEGFVSFAQNKMLVIDKPLSDCTLKGSVISLRLTQEETLRLRSDVVTEIQIRAKTTDGDVIASDIIEEETLRILKNGVI